MPSGEGWLHEVKFDGYRVQAHVLDGRPTLYTRTGNDWTNRFRPIATELASLPLNKVILDGEVIVPDEGGVSQFERLQADLAKGHTDRMQFYAFDLLYLDGFDLRRAPLIERKRVLQLLLQEASPQRIHFSSHADTNGPALFKQACANGLEGIICKKADAPYRSGRSGSWLKIKCSKSEVLPIIGFKPEGDRVTSLLLGRREGRSLVYAGKAGTGFTMEAAAEIRKKIDGLIVPRCPLTVPIRDKATWVKPELAAEVAYREITSQGLLRQAVFKSLREIPKE